MVADASDVSDVIDSNDASDEVLTDASSDADEVSLSDSSVIEEGGEAGVDEGFDPALQGGCACATLPRATCPPITALAVVAVMLTRRRRKRP